MNWKHWAGIAIVAIAAVAIGNRISAISKIMNNGNDLSGGASA